MEKIILASGSPRRSELLKGAEIPFEVIVVPTDESYPCNLPPREIAMHIASHKALAAQRILKNYQHDRPAGKIVSADTIVVLENQVIGKPKDYIDAIEILTKLSGKVHKVITGVCILSGIQSVSFYEETEVKFHQLSQSQINYYVDKFKPYDKAGAYAIQEWIGMIGVKSINGDFYNVMGLPVSRLLRELEKLP